MVVYAHQHRDCVRDRGDCRIWIAVKILRPPNHLDGIVVACCSTAICNEDASPFGDPSICNSHGLSYVSFSMAIANIYIWTHTYYIMKKSAILNKKFHRNDGLVKISSDNDSEITNVGREEEYRDYEALLQTSSEPMVEDEEEMVCETIASSSSDRNAGSNVLWLLQNDGGVTVATNSRCGASHRMHSK